jgi:signal transduction histidine kinase
LKKTAFKPPERKVLDSIDMKVSGGAGLNELVDSIFPEFSLILPCDRLDVGMVEENGQRVVIRHIRTAYGDIQAEEGYAFDVPKSFYERALEKMEPYAGDPRKHAEEFEEHDFSDLLVREEIRSLVIVPVETGGAIAAVILCGSRADAPYSKRQIEFLTAAAGLLRYPVEKAKQAYMIEKNYRSYMEMLGFVSHELRSPLSSIVTLAQTLAEGYYGRLEERQRDVMKKILVKTEYLYAMSSQYLNLSRFESDLMELRPRLVDFVDDIIEPIIAILEPQIEEREIKVEREYRDSIFPVQCDPDQIKIVMINLIGNGIKYGNRGGTLRLTIEKGFKKFSVAVWNEGPGFSEHEKHRLFKKFSRLQAAELIERKGSGIGLYVSWKIAQLHCGRIFAESEEGSWARFTVELPQYQDLCIIE